jgi:Glycosyl transferase family 11
MKLIARIKGGLGNQLFCYAAARRLALANDAELVIDDLSGFKRDHEYQRKYMLDKFDISARIATASERLEPIERIRRGILKKLEKRKPFEHRKYIEQEFSDFDARLLSVRLNGGVTYIDGLWQSELYFSDIESTIRKDLAIHPPTDSANLECARLLERTGNTVAIHVRWFTSANSENPANASADYYNRALKLADRMLSNPYYVIFSDSPAIARQKIRVPTNRVSFVDHNSDEKAAIWDLWLMTRCSHFIIANSTFSWWAAWLSEAAPDKHVFFPRRSEKNGGGWAWDYHGQSPHSWHPVVL